MREKLIGILGKAMMDRVYMPAKCLLLDNAKGQNILPIKTLPTKLIKIHPIFCQKKLY